ncbi:hypothetical protein DANDELION_9 [Mycobacterium phage Dandelion]|uniref:Uncharacterized protein n=1 Tax=Mycobacterium phage Dandelion TaxID=1074305 RepID=G1JVW1_9CAUD|nr:hypothetical protein DANDELION_9 [Mycobacterium phage Dandelion]AEL97679.1 hypothetical protein DANDELION_9 [Mycobacterium phage Dandelion]AVJ48522.1 hypothetical protein SEA_PIER_9 [Mycobacterium phage Pier]
MKIRRKGRIYRWEKALGPTPLFALESATNDLVLELENLESAGEEA